MLALVAAAGMKGWHAGPIANSVVAEALTSVLITLNRPDQRNAVNGALADGVTVFTAADCEEGFAIAERELELAPRSVAAFDAEELIGRFCDASWAYRFGPCAHAAAIATLTPADGCFVTPAAWFPPGKTATAAAADVPQRESADAQ